MSVIEPAPPDLTPLPIDDTIGASAMRKTSLHLLPLIALGYGVAYMDRVNISFASLQMNRDLHFSASVYGFGAGLFFVSYAACEIPSNLLLYRFGARRWLARIMLTWGLLAAGMMFVKTPAQFYVMRFLLGAAEAGFFPGIIFYLTQWFPAGMRARAVSRFYVSLPLSSVVMGFVAGALLNLQGNLGLAGWQWLFLMEGLPAILLSVVFLIYLPNGPAETKWLTEEERAWILNQLREDTAEGSHRDGVGQALLDRRVWLMSLLFLCMLTCNYAYTFSAPAILKQITNLSIANVGYLIAFMGLLGALGMVLAAMHSDRTKKRYWHAIVGFSLMAGGYLVGGLSARPLLTVIALGITVVSYYSMQGPVWAIASSFLKDKSAAAGIAAMNMIGMVGGFLGPYWMGRARDITGNYQRGLLTLALPSFAGAAIIFFLTLRRGQRRQLTG